MANSKIPNINATDTLNTFRLRTNQLLDSVGDVSTLTTTATDVTEAIKEHDAELGTISAAAMGTTASTVSTAINELDGRLDSINNTELLSLRATLSDSSATSLIKGKLQIDTDLHVGGNTTLGGSIIVDGEVTFKAGTNSNINLGDSNVDNIVFNADVNSNIIPNTNNTFDLGADSQQWRDVYVDGTVKTDNLAADSATITGDLTASGLIVATYIKHAGDLDTAIDFGDNSIALQTGGTTRVSINNNRFMILEDLLVTDSAYITGTVHAGNLVSLDSLGVGGNMSVQGTSLLNGNASLNGDMSVGGNASITGNLTGSATANVFNAGSTTVNLAGGGTAVNIGAATGTTTINHNLDVSGITNLDSTNVVGVMSVTGSLSVTEGFTVGGSFTTTGVQKSQASYVLLNETIAVNNINRAGVAIDRPGVDSALLQWNELGDYWEAGLTSDLKQLALQNDSANFTNIYQTGTAATRIPAGTTGQRPSGAQGQIRYNTSQSSFEGYSGTSWGSLGGLVDVDGDTKIIAERSAGNDSDTLTFFAGGTEVARMNDSGAHINVPTTLTDIKFTSGKIEKLDGSQLTLSARGGSTPIVQIQAFNDSVSEGIINLLANSSTGSNAIILNPLTGNIQLGSSTHGLVVDGYDIGGRAMIYSSQGGNLHNIRFPNSTNGEIELNATLFDINAAVEISSDVTVGGDFYVNGNTTYVNTYQLQTAARIIDLNHDVTGSPTQDAGIAVRRGTSDSAVLLWDESEDYWAAGLVGDMSRVATVDYLNASDGVSFDSASGKFAHADTSSQASVTSNNSGSTFIQDIAATLDTYGHVTGFTVGTATVPASTDTTYTTSIAAATTKLRLTGSDSSTDDIEFVGSGATTVTRTSDSKFTISSTDTNTDTNTTYTAGTDLDLTGTTFSLEPEVSIRSILSDQAIHGFKVLEASGNINILTTGDSSENQAITISATGHQTFNSKYLTDEPTFVFGRGNNPTDGPQTAITNMILRNDGQIGGASELYGDIARIRFNGRDKENNYQYTDFAYINGSMEIDGNDGAYTSGGLKFKVLSKNVLKTPISIVGSTTGTQLNMFADDIGLYADEETSSSVYAAANSDIYLTTGRSNTTASSIYFRGGSTQDVRGRLDLYTANELRFKTGSNTNNLRLSGNDAHIDGGLVVGDWTTAAVDNEVRALGDVTAYVSSDITLKENIVEINNAMDKISQIRGVYFDWTDEHIAKRGGEDGYFVHKADVGVIAQEVQAVLPEIVKERVDGTLAVEYQKMVALLIEGMKELKAEIQELKSGDK
tara:strand:- start:216 stop:4067 length:3852 start_codon:yes stop_codon:yes gene_type:complete